MERLLAASVATLMASMLQCPSLPIRGAGSVVWRPQPCGGSVILQIGHGDAADLLEGPTQLFSTPLEVEEGGPVGIDEGARLEGGVDVAHCCEPVAEQDYIVNGPHGGGGGRQRGLAFENAVFGY